MSTPEKEQAVSDHIEDVFWLVSPVLKHGGFLPAVQKISGGLGNELTNELMFERGNTVDNGHCIREQLIVEFDFYGLADKCWPQEYK